MVGERNLRARDFLRQEVGADFDWCGRCAGPPRLLTEPEVLSILQNAGTLIRTRAVPFPQVMYELEWILEIDQRGAVCTCGPEEEPIPRRGFYLYRLWGEERRLLYVGVSKALRARLRAHRRKLGDLIVGVTWEEHPDATSMLAAERAAIRDELPALNISGIDVI